MHIKHSILSTHVGKLKNYFPVHFSPCTLLMSHQIFSDPPQSVPSTSTYFDVEKLQRARRRKAAGTNGWWIAGVVAGILVLVAAAVVCYFYFTTPYSTTYEDDNSYVVYDPETGNITSFPAHPVAGSQNMQEIEFVHPYPITFNDLQVPSSDPNTMESAFNPDGTQEHTSNLYAHNSNDLEVPTNGNYDSNYNVHGNVPTAFNGFTHLQDVEGSEMDEVDAAFEEFERENLAGTSSDDESYEGLLDEVPAGFFRLNGSLHPMPAVVNSNVHQSNNPFNESFGSYEG